jgi:hypothetical protein
MRVQTGSVSVSSEQIDTDAQTEATSAPAEQTSTDRIESAQEAPNHWVAFVDHGKQAIDRDGTEALEMADLAGRDAEHEMDVAQKTARAAWAAGNYFAAAKALGEGVAKSAGSRLHQAADTGAAVEASVASGLADVAEGKKEAVEKVEIGGVFIAGVATGGASIAAEGLLAGGAEAIGTAMTTREIISGSGQMLRASDAKEFTLGAAKVALSTAFAAGETTIDGALEGTVGEAVEHGAAKLGEKAAGYSAMAATFAAGKVFELSAHYDAEQIIERMMGPDKK